ncbi:hypothetical protein E4U53_003357 [Claviceps sorghi]|nr:hypothetical protein E4U53_003357 [Claviceps sorghi]
MSLSKCRRIIVPLQPSHGIWELVERREADTVGAQIWTFPMVIFVASQRMNPEPEPEFVDDE